MAPSGAIPVPTPHLHLCLPPAIRASSPQCGGNRAHPLLRLTSPTISALPAQTCLSGRVPSKDSSSKMPLLILCTQTPPTATNTPPLVHSHWGLLSPPATAALPDLALQSMPRSPTSPGAPGAETRSPLLQPAPRPSRAEPLRSLGLVSHPRPLPNWGMTSDPGSLFSAPSNPFPSWAISLGSTRPSHLPPGSGPSWATPSCVPACGHLTCWGLRVLED